MTEQEALARMVAPGTRRPGKYRQGVIQVWVTRACDKACFGCTQGSNLAGKPVMITLDNFEAAVQSLVGYFGVVGVFGGNPAMHPQFEELCSILASYIPFQQRGLWCNNPLGKGRIMRRTFNPAVSNLNVHLDHKAFMEFRRDWPECALRRDWPVGLHQDSRHSPPYVAMKDVLRTACPDCGGLGDDNVKHEFNPCLRCGGTGQVYDEAKAWDLISGCDINRHWSAMIGQFRGQVRAWFCEIAGAQAMLHQYEPDYPDTGIDPTGVYAGWESHPTHGVHDDMKWWELPMQSFRHQVRHHCHSCGIPLRGHGELAQASDEEGVEQVSAAHQGVYRPKHKGRRVELVTVPAQLGPRLDNVVRYLQNSNK
jgi:hypothetical protein